MYRDTQYCDCVNINPRYYAYYDSTNRNNS